MNNDENMTPEREAWLSRARARELAQLANYRRGFADGCKASEAIIAELTDRLNDSKK